MKICVTGASGFLGQVLIRQLIEQGHEVIGVGRRPRPEGLLGDYLMGDLADGAILEKVLPGCSAIVHTAAKAGFWGSLKAYTAANITATRNVVKAAQYYRVPFLIHTSTASVVSSHQPIVKGDESLPIGEHHLCAYTYTKALTERIILKAHQAGALDTVILRPHLVWGKGDPHLFPRLIEKAKHKRLWQVGDGNNWVDMTHVENVAHAHVKALEALIQGKPVGGKAYFVTQNDPVPLWPWVQDFLKALELPSVNKKLSLRWAYGWGATLEKLYGLLPDRFEPPMTRFLAMELGLTHTFSSAAAMEAFDYAPIISFADGMEDIIEYWQTKRTW